jgi:hypothetical protein
MVYALPVIHAACSLVEKRVLTAEKERIVIRRSVHAKPVAKAFDRSQETVMLITNDTGRLVAASPSSSIMDLSGGGLKKSKRMVHIALLRMMSFGNFLQSIYKLIHFLEGHSNEDFTIVNLGKSSTC